MKKRFRIYTGAQLSLEYAVLIVCIVLALVAMQVYISRSIQGKMKDSVESIGGEQYAPGNTTSNSVLSFNYDTNTTVNTFEVNGTTNTITASNFSETVTRSTNEALAPY